MHRAAILAASVAAACAVAVGGVFAQSETFDASVRAILKELIEINTTESAGNTTRAAEAMAGRLRDAGFSPNDVQVIGPTARKGNLVARFRGTGARRPVLLLAHLDVVEAKREDWSFDPFTLLEKDGYFYGRGTSDDKGMAAQFMANLIRLKQERFVPDRDLILALTADEEGGDSNGVLFLLANHRDLIDAELAINEGGGGVARSGKYLVVEVQAAEKVYQDFRLEARNAGGHSSRPVRDNAIYHLSAALTRLADFEFPVNLSEVTRTYFERMASLQSNPKLAADMRAVAATAAPRRRSGSQPRRLFTTRRSARRAWRLDSKAGTRTMRCRSLPPPTSTAGLFPENQPRRSSSAWRVSSLIQPWSSHSLARRRRVPFRRSGPT